ncbi:MAG: hypothetical protein ACT4QD_11285 [Acidobacteriota bacterium]
MATPNPAAARLALVLAGLVLGAGVVAVASQAPAAQPSTPSPGIQRIGSMSELMVHLIYPTSDAVFYISSRTPKTGAEWATLEAQALMLAESANLLMMPGRARDQAQWIKDSRLMLDAGWAAFKAAKARDVPALEALSDQLYESCVTCHMHYRPDYGKRPPR